MKFFHRNIWRSIFAPSMTLVGVCDLCDKHFAGLTSIKVSPNNFELLFTAVPAPESNKYIVSRENQLLIFLMKMTGPTFSAISVIFFLHRTTVSGIFLPTVYRLVSAAEDLVFWPDKTIVQSTMRECFKPEYSDTRVIIDCT